jgi:glycerol kinase
MSILVIDVGTSGLRAAVVRPDATVTALHVRAFPPVSPFPGMVEFDASAMAELVIEVASAALAEGGPVTSVGVTTQRASTIVWDRATGRPVGPALGWQDLRTVIDCLTVRAEHGITLAPNQTATKAAWLLAQHDPDRSADLCIGTVDSWIVWVLTRGDRHVTDRTNAGVTGLALPDASAWNDWVCTSLQIPTSMLPEIVDTSSEIGRATALDGAPPITALVGDQQGSLIGQSCVRPGHTKITFGTGGMLDVVTGEKAPTSAQRNTGGTFPIVAWSRDGDVTWGTEGIMLSAGTNVEWLCQDMGLIDTPAHSHDVAAQCETTDGVVYVPALLGLGTPQWDYGARGTLLGITRGSGRAHIVRAVLEGVAHRGTDLVEAAESDGGISIDSLRVDGGMSQNPTFVQALANASGRPVEVSPITEATTLGAAYLAGLQAGTWGSLDDIEASWRPARIVEPEARLDRDQWAEAVSRATRWIPDLSALDF